MPSSLAPSLHVAVPVAPPMKRLLDDGPLFADPADRGANQSAAKGV